MFSYQKPDTTRGEKSEDLNLILLTVKWIIHFHWHSWGFYSSSLIYQNYYPLFKEGEWRPCKINENIQDSGLIATRRPCSVFLAYSASLIENNGNDLCVSNVSNKENSFDNRHCIVKRLKFRTNSEYVVGYWIVFYSVTTDLKNSYCFVSIKGVVVAF